VGSSIRKVCLTFIQPSPIISLYTIFIHVFHPGTAQISASVSDPKPSLWQSLKADNEARKAKEVQYVSKDEAERISGNGEQRVRKEEEERKGKGEKSGGKSLLGVLLL
jgi:hypothetical protein